VNLFGLAPIGERASEWIPSSAPGSMYEVGHDVPTSVVDDGGENELVSSTSRISHKMIVTQAMSRNQLDLSSSYIQDFFSMSSNSVGSRHSRSPLNHTPIRKCPNKTKQDIKCDSDLNNDCKGDHSDDEHDHHNTSLRFKTDNHEILIQTEPVLTPENTHTIDITRTLTAELLSPGKQYDPSTYRSHLHSDMDMEMSCKDDDDEKKSEMDDNRVKRFLSDDNSCIISPSKHPSKIFADVNCLNLLKKASWNENDNEQSNPLQMKSEILSRGYSMPMMNIYDENHSNCSHDSI
jgi:hypothetical protein